MVDEKFIDMAFREFEAVAPGANTFAMLGKRRPLRHIRSVPVMFLPVRRVRRLVQSTECAAVVFHSLGAELLPLLECIPADKRVIWLGWGHDYYERLLSGAFPHGLLLPRSSDLLRHAPRPGPIRALAAACKRRIDLMTGNAVRYRPAMLQRVDYFAPVLDSEYRLARELNPWFVPAYASWNYGTVESDMGMSGTAPRPLGQDILVGNSATIENNHLEVFEFLARHVELSGRRLIVPLNYGDDWYRERIIASGERQFGDKFVPLTTFVAREAYVELLHACGHVFMGHLRQQALANICIMMLKGAKIYMHPASPLYRWLAGKGAVISSIEPVAAASRTGRMELVPLGERERSINAEMVRAHWGQDAQRIRTWRLIELALGAG